MKKPPHGERHRQFLIVAGDIVGWMTRERPGVYRVDCELMGALVGHAPTQADARRLLLEHHEQLVGKSVVIQGRRLVYATNG